VRLADRPRAPCSSRVRRVRARLRFRSGFILGFRCSWFEHGPSFSSGQSGSDTDGPPGLRGRSVFLISFLVVLLALTYCPRHLAGQSVWPLRTVRGTWPDCPPGLCGQSVPPGWTVRLCLTALSSWPDSPPVPLFFLSCFRMCFKESFLRLEVDL
jgi:hypothetical protein